MPGKRVRKDSERSTGSFGTPCGGDVSPTRGAGSTSSGSVGDESENALLRTCCLPTGCPLGEDVLTNENMMVKVICNYDACKMSQFMHTDCFNHWEEGLLNYLRSHGRARSWSEKQRRQNLWTKKGYDLAFRACVCKCKHGHLRKDLDWAPQPCTSSGEQDAASGKKKNRKKHKDLPSLGSYNGLMNKTKSKPIPNNKDDRMRHSSASSMVSVDQGYISASPNTTEMGSFVFSPPSHTHKTAFPLLNGSLPPARLCNGLHPPSTSPLPEIPDDMTSSSPELLTPSPTASDRSPTSSLDLFSPPLSPEHGDNNNNKAQGMPASEPLMAIPDPSRSHPIMSEEPQTCTESNIQAMSVLINNLWSRNRQEMQTSPPSHHLHQQQHQQQQQQLYAAATTGAERVDATLLQELQLERALAQLYFERSQAAPEEPYRQCAQNLPQVPFNSPNLSGNYLENYHQEKMAHNGMHNLFQANQYAQRNHVGYNANPHVLLALQQKEQKEMEKRELRKYILSMMSPDETKTQVISLPPDRSRHNSHTEIRLVPMRSTSFTKRYDFSLFEGVLARQHINPYHIKMEGEGYGSDDLRNFILASLSKEKCSQMNCVVCGVDLPVYDHFPLVDGSMFLSPERNERSTRNCFKIKVEGKYEYIHAACMRCMEGLHNIVCRFCNSRWEGAHHQLGTLYMYDIFAATPCCQKRLCCKQCGAVVVDVRQPLTYFSEYSSQKTCPNCHAVDYHCVQPISSYQLMGIVFS